MKKRCEWCGSDPLYVSYHDDEWGVPVHDDRRLYYSNALRSQVLAQVSVKPSPAKRMGSQT
jgi:3-methyladenine DNA glycosylase Tag